MMVQNADIKVVLTLKDSDGVNLDPSAINDYQFFTYYMSGADKVLLNTYRKDNPGLFGVTYDSDLDTYTIIVNRESTSIFPSTKIYLETLVQLIDVDFINGFKNISSTGNLVTTIISSAKPLSLL